MIQIGFSRPNKWKIGSSLLQWWMGEEYSHVYLSFYSVKLERTLVYHAAMGSVHFIEAKNFHKINKTVKFYDIETTEEQKTKILQKCVDLAGNEYSYKQLGLIFLNDIGLTQTEDAGGYVCSELTAELLEEIFNKKFEKAKAYLRPDDIDNFLNEEMDASLG